MYIHKLKGWDDLTLSQNFFFFLYLQNLVRAQEAKVIEEKAAKIKDWVTFKLREVSYELGNDLQFMLCRVVISRTPFENLISYCATIFNNFLNEYLSLSDGDGEPATEDD